MMDVDSSSIPITKTITVARDINTGQAVILVDFPPGMHLKVLATHELQPHESYMSFYKKIVASDIFKRPNPNDSSSSTSGNNANATPDSAPSPPASTSSSSRGTKRKTKSSSNPESPQKETKRRKRRSYADIPPSTRVLRST